VELIKGSSSTLYGGGAIGGLVNLVSKKPGYGPDASFLVNQTTLKETNINAYYSKRNKQAGFTFFAGQTFQKEADVNKDGFSDVPNTRSTLIHPVLFVYPSSKTFFSLGWSGSFENRTGGDMIAVAGGNDPAHPYFEKNKLSRNSFALIGESRLDNTLTLSMKSSLSIFNRDESGNTYIFSGKQNNYYAELSLVKRAGKHSIVAGLNATGDDFKPAASTPVPVGDFSNSTYGVFMQDSWQFVQGTKLETGLRVDHHDLYGNFVLPRIAIFHRFNEQWGSRAGFGMGYTTPNPLAIQNKDYNIFQLQPIGTTARAEHSYGGNIEVNYKKEFGEGNSVFINHAFFITQINDPLTPSEDLFARVTFSNQSKPLLTKGFDTYIQAKISNWEIYVGYTYTDAERKYLPTNKFVPITPRNRAAATLLYEREGKWRAGLEASYNGYQYREDYTKTPAYLFMAAMAEKKFGPRWSLVLNCENLFDERQSRHEALFTGMVSNPSFKTLWGPIDGRIVNLCLRFQPFAK
jgi:iron complex outermembrane receptor protein/outer membrane receptor for ferrienterochelin and colicins